MRKESLIAYALFLGLCLFAFDLFSQTAKRNVEIILEVDTDRIGIDPIEKVTQLFDDNAPDAECARSTNPKNDTTCIYSRKRVTWAGRAKNGQDEVNILKIEQVPSAGDRRVLKCRRMVVNCRKFKGDRKRVRVSTRGSRHRRGVQTYQIVFSVKREGDSTPTEYVLDPKIRMRF